MYDVFFISYEEPNSESNWTILKHWAPHASRVHGVRGIANAHLECGRRAGTTHLFTIDGDSEVLPTFDFSFRPDRNEFDHVFIWRCVNAVNDLSYGHGGIKLWPRLILQDPPEGQYIDFTLTVAKAVKVVDEVGSYSHFNTSPYQAWKAAFRECVKLATSPDGENIGRLQTWMSKGSDRPFGDYCIRGAIDGCRYGQKHLGDFAAISRINDFDWLKEKFRESCS